MAGPAGEQDAGDVTGIIGKRSAWGAGAVEYAAVLRQTESIPAIRSTFDWQMA